VTSDTLLDPDAMPNWLAQRAREHALLPHVNAGIDADDCAVVTIGDSVVVITTDFLNASPIAEQLGLGSLADLGRLLVLANLSDLCGTGAEPKALLVAVTLPRESTEADFHDLMGGVLYEASRWNAPLVGGDTKLGSARALLAVAVGTAPDVDALFLKRAARAGDDLWISGPVGACAAAALGLSRLILPDSDSLKEWARHAILHPELPLQKSRAAAATHMVNGGTDLSDGLSADLVRLCQASAVGAEVDAEAIPLEDVVREIAERLGVPALALALSIGGDLQFLLTAPTSAQEALLAAGFTRIGAVTSEPALTLRLSHCTVAWPSEGHRDGRRVTFAAEIDHISRQVAQHIARPC
jgi:thiamine-monophosphate kinase